jgi:glycosyltransferase involved in cell wall biosynthesis
LDLGRAHSRHPISRPRIPSVDAAAASPAAPNEWHAVAVSSPVISAVICSYNRRALARRAVESLLAQSAPHDRFEIVFVDNNSSDGTVADALALARSFPQLRVFRETRQRLSFARNRGAKEARGRFVAFLDDDAVASPGWINALLRSFERRANTVAVGGRIELEWSLPRPRWLSDDATGWLGHFALPPERCELVPGKDNLRGGNMAIERAALLAVGLFDTRLGRSSRGIMGNGEIEFQRRLERLARPILYAHDAVVSHLVHPERTEWRWFLRRAFDQGRSDVRLEAALDAPTGASGLLGSLARSGYCALRAVIALRPSIRASYALRATLATGALFESRHPASRKWIRWALARGAVR